jgi:hypothetical protein
MVRHCTTEAGPERRRDASRLRNFPGSFSFSDPPMMIDKNASSLDRCLELITRKLILFAGFMAVVVTVVSTPTAGAVSGPALNTIFKECSSGHLAGTFTVRQLQDAMTGMPTSLKQYTSCPDVVQTAIFKAAQHNRGGTVASASSGPLVPTPLVVILALLVAAAAGFGLLAIRRRQTRGDGGDPIG